MRIVLPLLIMALLPSLLMAVDAAASRDQGIAALKESQTNPRSIVAAARHFAIASAAYEAAGATEQAVEMNSYLFWCKKKMNLEDIEQFTKSGESVVAKKLLAVEKPDTKPEDAQIWFDRADTFARNNPAENLLIAIRFYEVASLFKGTDVSLTAMDRSLKAMQVIGPKSAGPALPEKPAAGLQEVAGETKQPIPTAAAIKQSEKEIRDTFKIEYSGKKPEDRAELVRKLSVVAAESPPESPDKYVSLREIRDLAVTQLDVRAAFEALDTLDRIYAIDKFSEAAAMLQRFASIGQTELLLISTFEMSMRLADEASKSGKFSALKALLTPTSALFSRLPKAAQTPALKHKLAKANEISKEWTLCQPAIAKLKTHPNDAAANLSAGRFYCLVASNWELGLPSLALGSDADLRAAAQKEAVPPAAGKEQAAAADAWLDIAKKTVSPVQKAALEGRALYWYSKALPMLAGLEKHRVEKRISEIRKDLSQPAFPVISIISAKYGTGDRNVDLTERLKKDFEANPFAILCASALGMRDPANGISKQLRAEILIDGKATKIEVADHDFYIPTAYKTGVEVSNTAFKLLNVQAFAWENSATITHVFEAAAKDAETPISFKYSAAWKTDPAPGAQKSIAVWFESGGKRYLRRYAEGQTCPIRP